MIRMTLIQIENTKLDIASALSSLDKLMKANELNFGLISVIPSGLIAWKILKETIFFSSNRARRDKKYVYEQLRIHLRFFFFLKWYH